MRAKTRLVDGATGATGRPCFIKLVAKRVSEEDHSALTRYAESRGVKVAELLAPAVEDLIARAHAFCEQDDALPRPLKVS